MKAGLFAVAAAMATGVVAKHHARHNHAALHARHAVTGTGSGDADATCDCSTVYYTTTGEPTLYFPPCPTTTSTSSAYPTLPTPYVTTFPTTGTYTIPATTITVTEETTVCAATQTPISSGTHTVGGVTTIVETSTTIVCPYATTTTSEGVVTSTILTTTYVCPTAGTYTIAPLTTTVSESTVWVYPIPATYPVGTYTQSEVVTTVTETDVVYVCPYTSPAPEPTYAPTPAPEPTTSIQAEPTKTPVTVGGSGGNHWAITYTPYDASGACKNLDSVNEDVSDIAQKGFKALRVYSTDCSALEHIGPIATEKGLKLILGVFITNTGTAGAQEQIQQIASWAQWAIVDLIVIGNESIMNGYVSGSQLASFIQSAQSTFKSKGYTGPVTTTEPLSVWQANKGALCGAVDIVGCNIHPFFNPDVPALEAGKFVSSQLDIVDSLCPGKTGLNLETGWPSKGSSNGLAIPGVIEQSVAVLSIAKHAGDRSVILSYANDDWKNPGPFGCEQFWGAVQLFSL